MTAGGNTSATSQDVLGLHFRLAQYQCDTVALEVQSLAKQTCTKSCRYNLFINSSNDVIEVSVVHLYIYKKNAYSPPSQVEHALSWVWKHTLLLELYLCLSSPLSSLPPPPSSHQQEGLVLLKVSSHWKGVFCHCCLFEGQTLRISEAHRDNLDWFRPITVWYA